jgi:DNA-binding GntR family transcriptional regulator
MAPELVLPLKPAPRLTLGESVAKSLRDAIFKGLIQPGQRFSEAQIAERLDVSRAPVREALAQLEQEGLVFRTGSRGIAVSLLSRSDVEEVCTLRFALESLAARRVFEHATEEDFAALGANIQETRKARDAEGLALLDLQFHELLVRAANHRRLLASWLNLRSLIQLLLVQRNLSDVPSAIRGTARSHAELLKVIRERDEERTIALLEANMKDQFTWFVATFCE